MTTRAILRSTTRRRPDRSRHLPISFRTETFCWCVAVTVTATDRTPRPASPMRPCRGTARRCVADQCGFVTTPINTVAYPDGPHALDGAFVDGAGNSGSIEKKVVIDNSAPVVTITSPATGTIVDKELMATAVARRAKWNFKIDVIVDGNSVAAYTLSGNVLTLAMPLTLSGKHTVAVNATDTAGNVGHDSHDFF